MAFSSLGIFAQSVTELEFETSSDLNSWESLSLRDLLQTGDGKLQHSADEANLWYRLKIQRGNQIQINSKVALADVPENLVKIAEDFLADFADNELGEGSVASDSEGWGADSVLADYAYPLYNPGILGGSAPALYEFVIGIPPEPEFTPGPLTPNSPNDAALIDIGGQLLVESTDIVRTGSVLVSATDQVEPIPYFATEGDAQVAKLLARAGTPNVKAIWYDVGFLAGEDASGKLIATVGNTPFKVDSTPILAMIDQGVDSYENIDTLEGSSGPDIQGKQPEFFRSYDGFKTHYLTDPLMVELRERRAKAAILDWDIATGKQPNLVNVTIGEQSLIEKGQSVTSFDINVDNFEDEVPGNIEVVIPDTGGAILVGREAGPVILTLTYENGTSSVVLVNVSEGDVDPPQRRQIGDVNCDGAVNVSDLVLLANVIVGNGNTCCPAAADINRDGALNVLDQQALGAAIQNGDQLPFIEDCGEIIVDPGGGIIVDPGGGIGDPGIVPRGGVPKGWGSWTSWKSWYAGSWSDQRQYWQFNGDSQMCPDGYSGCGPTAWAMLYGWWDHKGAPEALGNSSRADAPSSNDDDVRACCRYVFDEANTWCVPLMSAAATDPWQMYKGCRWGVSRGVSYSFSTSYGIPYVSTGPRNKAKNAIKDGYPSILGVGFYVHFPLAYGYKYRKYKLGGDTWYIQRKFKCNDGQGGSSAKWYSGSSVWFGQRVRLW